MLTGPAPGAPKFELRDPTLVGQERLFGDHPGQAELGIVDRLEALAEGAVAVAPKRRGEEPPVLPAELLLDVDAERLVLKKRFGGRALGGPVDVARTGNREDQALAEERRQLLIVVLGSNR